MIRGKFVHFEPNSIWFISEDLEAGEEVLCDYGYNPVKKVAVTETKVYKKLVPVEP